MIATAGRGRNMAYEPTNLERWKRPRDYFGAEWPGWYVFLGQHRDSDILTRSNFRCAWKAVEPFSGEECKVPDDSDDAESTSVRIIRENHWAVGWVEWIGIHDSNAEALKVADDIAGRLENYPVVDDDDFSAIETEEAEAYWSGMSIRERIHYTERFGLSCFAARHDLWTVDAMVPSGGFIQALND